MASQTQLYVKRRAERRPDRPLLSIVVPMFNEEEVIDEFLSATGRALADQGVGVEYVFVDDGSTDASGEILAQKLASGVEGRLIVLSRNFGKEAALTAGLEHARGDIVVVIDADLQDPPELIPQMIELWRGGYDVIYGLREDRSSDTLLKRGTANLFYRAFNRLAHIEMPANAGDFRLMDRCVVDALLKLPERNRFMKGLFAWVGYPSLALPYERKPRKAGVGKWNYWKLWNFALDGFTGFTTVPLRIWFYGGALIALAAFAYALFLVARVFVYGVDMPGYASLMTAILFFSGIQLLSIGMIGEYISRLFTEAKNRPVFLVQDVIEGTGVGVAPPVVDAEEKDPSHV